MIKIKKFCTIIIFCVEFWFFVNAQTSNKNYGICQTPDKKLGYCIQHDKCPLITDTIKEIGESWSEPQFADKRKFIVDSKCGEINGKILVCCEDSIFGNPNLKDADTDFLLNRFDETLLPTEEQCIVPINEKVAGGQMTQIDEFPWTAVLLYSYKNNNSEAIGSCGGSLISNRYVITAAHCAHNKYLIQDNKQLTGVRLGEWDKSTAIDCVSDSSFLLSGESKCAPPHEDISIEKIIIHENYNSEIRAQYNDIALLRLSRTVQFSNFISPICLPLTQTVQNLNLTGFAFDVTGWGKTEYLDRSPIKLKATLNGISLDSCNMILEKSLPETPLKETQICTIGKTGMDSCKGDSGGPLIGTYQSKIGLPYYYLVGIVSIGQRFCGQGNVPSINTRVTSFVPWIQNNIKK